MIDNLEEFYQLLQLDKDFPLDELKDHYFVPARATLNSNPHIVQKILNDKTALTMVVEQLLMPRINSIREIELNLLAMDIVEKCPKEILNYQDVDGNSVIHLSTRRESFSVGVLDLIYSNGGSFSLVNKKGETPLIQIATNNSLDDVKFIHAYTLPEMLDWQDNKGNTALMHAIKQYKLNNIFFFLSVGANLHKVNKNGFTPLEFIMNPAYIESCEPQVYRELLKVISKHC